jgi:hypothetical protein
MTSSVLRHDTPLTAQITGYSTLNANVIEHRQHLLISCPSNLDSYPSSIKQTNPSLHTTYYKINPTTHNHIKMSTTGKLGTGMASDTKTPANAGIGETKPSAFDAKGAVGHAFTGMTLPSTPTANHAVTNELNRKRSHWRYGQCYRRPSSQGRCHRQAVHY